MLTDFFYIIPMEGREGMSKRANHWIQDKIPRYYAEGTGSPVPTFYNEPEQDRGSQRLDVRCIRYVACTEFGF